MMAMTQMMNPSPSPATASWRKKRQLMPNRSPSRSTSNVSKESINMDRKFTDQGNLITVNDISQLPFPSTNLGSSAMTSYLRQLKQSTSILTFELISDNAKSSAGLGENATTLASRILPKPLHWGLPKQHNGKPRHINMTRDQKKNIRWDTHSCTYKVAAAGTATQAIHISNRDPTSSDSTSSHDSIDTHLVMGESTVRRSSSAAPTCPLRRQSKEDCLQVDTDEEEHSNDTDLYTELATLLEKIEMEEMHLKVVVDQPHQKIESLRIEAEQRQSVRSQSDILHQATTREDKPKSPRKSPQQRIRKRREPVIKSTRDGKFHDHRPKELPLSRKFQFKSSLHSGTGELPDYHEALSAVAERYALGSGNLSNFRSASTGVLPAATSTGDSPLGVPRRRGSADFATLAALDEATR